MNAPTLEGTSPRSGRWLATSSVALTWQLGLQLLIGLWLSFGYDPNVAKAHASVAAMHADGLTRILQGAHYWGSAVFILHSALHLAAMTWFGWFARPHGVRYFAAIVMLLCALGFQLSGNLLPYDRHGVQTATIEASIAARAPVVGPMLTKATLGGAAFGQNTVDLWYLTHRILLPALSLAALGLSIWVNRRRKDAPVSDKRLVWVPALFVLLLAALVPSPFGSPATPDDFDAFAAKSSWYMWPLHGTMRLFDSMGNGLGWIGALLLPGLMLLFLVALPLSKGKISLGAARGGLGAIVAVLFGCALLLGGTPASLTGTRDPVTVAAGPKPTKIDAIDKALVEKGRVKFNELTCAACHGKDGKEAGGGPALTNTWKRHPDADYYIRYIVKPTAVKAGSTMPAFPDTPKEDLAAMAEFLRSPK